MQYEILGKSGLKISEIGFGCMSLSENQDQNSDLLLKALDSGINFFDTADLYQHGFNEETVGKAFKNQRDKVIIATKVGNQWRTDGSGWDWNPNKSYILQSVDESLRRLQTDYIDLYQLHGGTINDPIDETIEAFELLQTRGKIRFYGISSIRPNVIREYVTRSNITSVMMQYSLLDRRPEESCLDLLKEYNIGVLTRGGLAKGLLVDKKPTQYLNHDEKAVEAAAVAIRDLSDENRLAAQTALRYILHHPAVTCAVTGIRTERQLVEAAGTTETPGFSSEEYHQLQNAVPAYRYEQHR